MPDPQQSLQDETTAASATGKRLRDLEAEVAALKQELSSAHAALRAAGLRSTALLDNVTSLAAEDRASLTSVEAENATLRRTNAGLAEEGRALRASEGQLTRLLETAPVAILETDAAGTFVYANRAATSILGLAGLHAEGRRFDALEWHLTWPDGRTVEPQERPIARALRGEAVEELEICLAGPHRTTQSLVLRVAAVPVYGNSEKIEGVLATLVDVSVGHMATAALQTSEERSRLAFEIAGACAWELDPGTGSSTWDAAARTLLDLPENLPFAEAVAGFVHQGDHDRVYAAVASALDPAGDGRYSLEHRGVQAQTSSGERWLLSLGQPTSAERGRHASPFA